MSIVTFLTAAIPGTKITAGSVLTSTVTGLAGGMATAIGVVLVCVAAKNEIKKEYGIDIIEELAKRDKNNENEDKKKKKNEKVEKVKVCNGSKGKGKEILDKAKDVTTEEVES